MPCPEEVEPGSKKYRNSSLMTRPSESTSTDFCFKRTGYLFCYSDECVMSLKSVKVQLLCCGYSVSYKKYSPCIQINSTSKDNTQKPNSLFKPIPGSEIQKVPHGVKNS